MSHLIVHNPQKSLIVMIQYVWSVSLFRKGHSKSNGWSCLQFHWASQADWHSRAPDIGGAGAKCFQLFWMGIWQTLSTKRHSLIFLDFFSRRMWFSTGPKYRTILCIYPVGLGPQRRKCKKLKKWSTSLVILSLTVEIEDSVNAWYTPADAAGTS